MYCATPKINLTPVGGVSYNAERWLRDVRFYTAQSPFGGVRYMANWRQVYFALDVLCNSQNKLGASWGCIFYCRMATPRCKILHRTVAVRGVRYTANWRQVYFCLICTVQLPLLHLRTAIWQGKIHRKVGIPQCIIHRYAKIFWISPRIFGKNWKCPRVTYGMRRSSLMQKPTLRNLVTLSL